MSLELLNKGESKLQIKNLEDVVAGEYCVGCGACSYVSKCGMSLNEFGEYIPDIKRLMQSDKKLIEMAELACPSLNPEQNEDVLGGELFGEEATFNDHLGFIQETYAGYAIEGEYRENGTSGGMVTWVASELFRLGLIDGVIHVHEFNRQRTEDPFFSYGISRTLTEIKSGAKTRYHVVEMSAVLDSINDIDGRFLFVGVPCLSKAVRRLQKMDSSLVDKIPFVVSLVCGHLKSVNWSLSLAWGAGIHPKDAQKIQYRTKGEGIPARAYVYRAGDKNEKYVQKDSASVVGGKFNVGAMMLPACDYCDDVVGETSDLTIGDAWIPRFDVDSGGTNLLLVRNTVIHTLLKNALSEKRIVLEKISTEEAINSQEGGFRQRREGLSHRLEREILKGNKVPKKRVSAGQFKLSNIRKKIYDGRSEVTIESRDAFLTAMNSDDYSVYSKKMEKKLNRLRLTELRSSFFRLAFKKIKRIILSKIRVRKNND